MGREPNRRLRRSAGVRAVTASALRAWTTSRSTRLVLSVLSSLALVACGTSPSAPPGATASTLGLDRFDGESLSFAYPDAWRAARFEVVSSFSHLLVYLSTAAMSDPCDRTPNSIACVRSAVSALGPDGILVEWSGHGFPGWTFDPTKGRPMLVDGRRATLEHVDPSGGHCQAIGGERELLVTIDDPTADMNWTEMRACLRGPSLDGLQAQVESMLASVTWRP